MGKLIQALNEKKILCSDGAWGTMLFQKGLKPGECPELWNLTNREHVLDVAKQYVAAGSDLIETNSFGGNRIKLSHYSLESKTAELNKIAAKISREAAGTEKLVAGSIGPTGKFVLMGDTTSDELYDVFAEQATALQEGGADAIVIETFYALDEAEAAIKAVKENTNLDVICSFTFDKTALGEFRTMMGVSPEQMVESIISYGADIIGTNCGSGFEQIIEIVKLIRTANPIIPILAQANAGMPQSIDGKLVYLETPEATKSYMNKIIGAGANIIGGCCGRTPEHIREISNAVKKYNENVN